MRSLALALGVGMGLSVLSPLQSFGAPASQSPAGQSYDARPDILNLDPKPHPELGDSWRALRRGHLEAVAQILELHPDQEIYFLARDSELLYDLARAMTVNDPQAAQRLHLLNVSRANMNDHHIQDYLAQEGISEAELKKGKKILFVDTGFSGTIPERIESYFNPEVRAQLNTHLICSSNPAHPSTRVFLSALNPAAPELAPGSMHGSIVDYEYMPRYTDRSTTFQKINGRWQAISQGGGSRDGKVDPRKAQAYMEDLRAYAQSDEAKSLLNERRSLYKNLYSLLQQGEGGKEPLHRLLLEHLSKNPGDPFAESLVRDFIETAERHYPESARRSGLWVARVGLKEIATNGPGSTSNKNVLIKKFPQWAHILQDPETHIPKLIQQGDFQTLGAIADVIQDIEFLMITAKELGKHASNGKVQTFLVALIDKRDVIWLDYLVSYTLHSEYQWDSKIHQAVANALEDKNAGVRRSAAPALGNLKSTDPKIHQALVSALTDEDFGVRRVTAGVLGHIGPTDPKIHIALANALTDQQAEVRGAAVDALGRINPADPKIHEAIAGALTDEDPWVRRAAVMALGNINPADPIIHRAIAGALTDEEPLVREATAKALGNINPVDPKIHLALAGALTDQSPQVRVAAIDALGRINPADPKVHQALANALKDGVHVIRQHAIYALGKIKPTDPQIHQALANALGDQESIVYQSAVLALGNIRPTDPKIHQAIANQLQFDDEILREWAAEALKKINQAKRIFSRLSITPTQSTYEASLLAWIRNPEQAQRLSLRQLRILQHGLDWVDPSVQLEIRSRITALRLIRKPRDARLAASVLGLLRDPYLADGFRKQFIELLTPHASGLPAEFRAYLESRSVPASPIQCYQQHLAH